MEPQKPEEEKPFETVPTEDKENNLISERLNNLTTVNPSPARDFFGFIFDLLKTGAIVLVLALIIRYFAIQPFIVDGNSMVPNYHDKEYLLAEKLTYLFSTPKRGDVIVFKFPKNPSVNYIKRIIGVPGDTVKIKDNQIIIVNNEHKNGIVLKEVYLDPSARTEAGNIDGYEKTLFENEYFVLGDNRSHSSDSREWGVLPKSNILGRSWVSIAKLGREDSNIPEFYFKLHDRINFPL